LASMKAVLFDLGHTLIDYYCDWKGPEMRGISRIHDLVSQALANPPEKEEFVQYLSGALESARERKEKELIEIPLIDLMGQCLQRYGCDSEEVLIESLNIFYGVLLEDRKLVEGAPELLARLKDEGYGIGLVSDVAWGLPSDYPMKDIRFYKMDEYFDDFVFSTDVGIRKPHPRMFKIALSNIDSSAGEAVFIGNNLYCDVKGAQGVGMKAILKKSHFCPQCQEVTPDAVVSTLDEVEKEVKRLLA